MSSDNKVESKIKKDPISKRAAFILDEGVVHEYLTEHFSRFGEPYHKTERPNGYIPFCVAENKQIFDLVEPKLSQRPGMNITHLGYNDFRGTAEFREALAAFLKDYVFKRAVEPSKLGIANGAGPLVEMLFWALCDENDGVIVPAPYYSGFDMDLTARAKCKILPANMNAEDDFAFDVSACQKAVEEGRKQGIEAKALLLTSPNNPLGRSYTRDELQSLIDWAKNNKIAVVVDEVYALSLTQPSEKPFVSICELMTPDEMREANVHVLYSFSKDFGMSGFRVGLIYSETQRVLDWASNMGFFYGVSTDTQFVLTSMLKDRDFLERYVTTMQQRLADSYQTILKHLGGKESRIVSESKTASDDTATANKKVTIRVLPADAGIFVFIDCRAFLPLDVEPSLGENRLWRHVLETQNLNLSTGHSCHCETPGFMRLCYAMESEVLQEALRRLTVAFSNLPWPCAADAGVIDN